MITYIESSVFEASSNVIVNTVNCKGKMSSGIALECSCRFPNMFKQYCIDCKEGKVNVGEFLVYEENGFKIINFPTKDDCKKPSKIEYIEKGLDYFVDNYERLNLTKVAFPLLGCKSGKLDFENQVKPILEKKLSNLNIEIIVCKNSFPDSKSKLMLETLKKVDLNNLKKKISLSDEQIKNISEKINLIESFDEIKSKTFNINSKTYREIYNYIDNLINI